MNPKGNIWLAGGKRNVGKTHTAMEIAQEFFLRSNVPKSIIVFDHTHNSSYNPYALMPLTIGDLYFLPRQERIKGIVRSDDIDGFAQVVTEQVERCSILFDDCGVLFRGNLTRQREKLLKTPKNNGNELIFQAHSFREIAPALLEQANMYIVKETVDDPTNLPSKVIARQQIGQLLIDVIKENFGLESNKKWATRIYDTEDDEVWIRDTQTGIFHLAPGEDYFPFSNKKRFLM
ncbi:hypothetical protein [Runella salmonicolor]|uniref:Uncharacterized protein n=1 Tax=Runella salmonicolor TaxID=2950278 RepID=A0ABT1FXC9_9BACT|nr:hypothetical protein [Runella salmonicolor]MCP1386430.1 hypothetical protein [Runella salmonicolor]